MSKVFRRPMIRKGGSTNGMTGIMSGIQDRNNYQDAGRVGELTKENLDLLMQNAPQDTGFDPLTTFLLQFGPSLATAKPTGNIVSTALSAAQKPVESLLASQAERRKYLRDLKSGAAQLAIEQAGKEKLLEKEIAGRKEIAGMEKGEGVFKPQDFFEEYGSLTQAKNRSEYENLDLETKAANAFGQSYEGFIGGKHGRLKDYEKKSNIGNIYYDVTDGTFKQLRETKDGYAYKTLDTKTYDPDTDKKTPPPKEPPSGLFGQKPKPKKTFKEAFDIGDVPPFDPYGGA
jgi:hypothetical protein